MENQENTGSIRGHAGMAAAYSLTASDFSSCLDGQYTVVSNLCLTILVHTSWAPPRPRARAYLITKQDQYSFEDFTGFYSSSLSVSWPYSAADVVARSHSSFEEEVLVASPIFEQHLRVLENWKVGKTFASKFPILGAIITKNDWIAFDSNLLECTLEKISPPTLRNWCNAQLTT